MAPGDTQDNSETVTARTFTRHGSRHLRRGATVRAVFSKMKTDLEKAVLEHPRRTLFFGLFLFFSGFSLSRKRHENVALVLVCLGYLFIFIALCCWLKDFNQTIIRQVSEPSLHQVVVFVDEPPRYETLPKTTPPTYQEATRDCSEMPPRYSVAVSAEEPLCSGHRSEAVLQDSRRPQDTTVPQAHSTDDLHRAAREALLS